MRTTNPALADSTMKTADQHHPRFPIDRWAWWLVGVIIAMAVIGAFACRSPRKAERQLQRAHSEFPTLTAKACADWYPVKTHDSVRVEFRKGETVTRLDTVRVDCDEIRPDSGGRRVVYARCPPCQTRTDTLLRTWTQVRENTARVRELQAEVQEERDEKRDAESSCGMWRFIALLALGYILLRILLRRFLKINLP